MRIEPRKKELCIVNPGKGGKRKGTTRRRSAPRVTKAKARRSSRRRRNPGMDVSGTLMAAAAGAATALVLQPLTHQAAKRVRNRPIRAALRTLGPAIVGVGVGTFVGKQYPGAGKAIAGTATALGVLHGLSELANGGATPSPTLQAVGYAQLGAAEDVFVRDGQAFRVLPDGSTAMLFGVSAAPVELQLDDGSTIAGTMLGDLGEGEVLVMDAGGNLLRLPTGDAGVAGIEKADDGLGGIEKAEELAGPDDEDLSGVAGDDDGYEG
ncbi:hypothetical protein [Myxococcus stipitatus]|uniref:hypothetical protein n=1 Tax=Myxococcus stipitatus TaxID=83455 RepID=UPI0030CC6B93